MLDDEFMAFSQNNQNMFMIFVLILFILFLYHYSLTVYCISMVKFNFYKFTCNF